MTNGGLHLQVGYTTTMIKTLIRHQNMRSMPEFNIEIIRRGVELKSVTFLWVTLTYNGTNGGLHFRFWIFKFSSICFRKKMILETFMCLNL